MRPSDRAWIALGVGVVAWDAACPRGEMLSEASARYAKTRPWLWKGLVVYVAGHLMHIWPERIDLLTVAAKALGR